MPTAASIARRAAGTVVYVAFTVGLLLRTAPGRVGIDTKQYLFLDPAAWLADAPTMWQPETAFGTVPHQNVGFLWPIGPFFWAGEALGLADWVTQRLWIAALLVAAGLGVRALGRHLGLSPAGAWAAALVYAWGPYTLGYVHRTSVLLLPWAGIGWLVLFAARAVRRGGWRDPAAFALVALTVGGANATAFLLAGLAPLLWVVHEALDPEVGWARAARAAARIGVLTVGTSLWWAVALAVQGRYSLNVLLYSETIDAVARSTTATEVLRGLGYWLFYGRDRLAPWIEPAPDYQTSSVLIALTFLLPLIGALALVTVRGRHRAFSASALLVGLVIAIGAYPWSDPSILGSVFRDLAEETDFGLALRSSSRAVPLLALGLALPTGALVTALAARARSLELGSAAMVGAVALLAFPPLWQGTLVSEDLSRPEDIPQAWVDAVEHLDERPHDTRILEVPGTDLAFHRWGAVWEPITPGLTDRPHAARELIPYGGPGSVDLLRALDRRMQDGTLEPTAIAPIARLLGAGDILVRSDLEYERFRTPRPRTLWDRLRRAPGLTGPTTFGEPTPNVAGPELPLLDEIELATPPDAPHPPPVAVFGVEGTRPLVHASSLEGALLVAGSGEGLVDAAAAGVLRDPALVLYAATLASEPSLLEQVAEAGADVLLTDSNRRRAERWRTLRDNTGLTEAAGETPLVDDPSDARLELFPDAGDESHSVTVTTGARAVATAYGNPIAYVPAQRPQLAIDGDPSTAWEVGAFSDPRGERLVIDLEHPRTVEELTVRPAETPGRRLARLGVRVDGRPVGEIEFADPTSPRTLSLPGGEPVDRIELEVLGTDPPSVGASPTGPAVGIAEVTVPGLTATEAVRLPVDLLRRVPDDLQHRLVVQLSRLRSDPAEVVRADDEVALDRLFELPSARRFALGGTARVSARAPDAVVWELIGADGPAATASDTLGGDLRSRPWAALDGDPDTAWQPGFGPQAGRWIEVHLGGQTTVDRLDLQVLADGRHSVPSRLRIEAGGEARSVELPEVTGGERPGAVADVSVSFPPLSGDRIRVTVEEVRAQLTRDWYQLADIEMPVGIAELGLPGAGATTLRQELEGACRPDLVVVDGRPLPVQVTGTVAAVLDRRGLEIATCDGEPVPLDAGTAAVGASDGRSTGIDVDRLLLASAVGGGPDPLDAPLGAPPSPVPGLEVLAESSTEIEAVVDTGGADTMVVLGQNRNDGWHAVADGEDLGPPVLVDGYANGWVIPGRDQPVEVTFRWPAQRAVDIGLVLSAVCALLCAFLVLRGRRGGGATARIDRRPGVASSWATADPLRWGPSLACAGVAAGIALVVARPVSAAIVAILTLVAARTRHGAVGLGLTGVGALAVAFGLVVLEQRQHRWPADFDWPTHFDRSHHLAVLAVLLVVSSVALDRARRRPLGDPGTRDPHR